MASTVELSADSPKIKPRFNLGGQVSRYSSNPQIFSESLAEENDEPRPTGMASNFTPTSLNPELLMREFTQDEQGRIDSLGATDSPSACFQSQFAREVVQNTRRSSSILDNVASLNARPPPSSSLTSNRKGSSYNSKYRSQFAAKHHHQNSMQHQQQDDSDSTSEDQDLLRQKLSKRANNNFKASLEEMPALPASTHGGVKTKPVNQMMDFHGVAGHFDDDEEDDENLWMTSTQFSQMLDKQEAYENLGYSKVMKLKSPVQIKATAKKIMKTSKPENISAASNLITSTGSFLDQNAQVPLGKLKKTCEELGFTYSDKEWVQIRKILSKSSENRGKADDDDEEELVVRNEDFFAAIHAIMSNKQNRYRLEAGKHHPNSMKSDSGGEMESCRSSDSELERELHEKEREIEERERELTNCYHTIAERDTELIRVRLECQRLLEDNREIKAQFKHIQQYSNPKRQMDLEKEIENLKWHLGIMENSRKSYESATQQLVAFLDHVTLMLQATSPSQRKLFEATKAQVLRTTGKTAHQKRFSLDASSSSAMFRAESMPGLNMRGSLLSLSTTGGDNLSLASSNQTMPRRHASSSSSSASSRAVARHVHRSQSTHSKRSPMPSLQESDYVNTDVINDYIREEAILEERPKSVAEISQQENVCKIQIRADLPAATGSTSGSNQFKKTKAAKRSVSSASSARPSSTKSDKASRLLGIEEQQSNTSNTDSGRFSMGSSLSPVIQKADIVPSASPPSTVDSSESNSLKSSDRAKYKSLGDLQIEQGLPTVLVHSEFNEVDEEAKTSLLQACKNMLKNTKKLLVTNQHKTLEITPVKASKTRSSLPGGHKQTLQLISHTSFPGLPTYPVLAASHSSPWNC